MPAYSPAPAQPSVGTVPSTRKPYAIHLKITPGVDKPILDTATIHDPTNATPTTNADFLAGTENIRDFSVAPSKDGDGRGTVTITASVALPDSNAKIKTLMTYFKTDNMNYPTVGIGCRYNSATGMAFSGWATLETFVPDTREQSGVWNLSWTMPADHWNEFMPS